MRTLGEIASALRERAKTGRVTQESLRKNAGISRQTLTNVLSGNCDYKVTTLLAIVDRLGLELVLVPKAAAAGLAGGFDATKRPTVKSIVQEALERLHSKAPGVRS
jgi:transcriptional regulator with XRE-family HTH domain